jgi:hypothetical protein
MSLIVVGLVGSDSGQIQVIINESYVKMTTSVSDSSWIYQVLVIFALWPKFDLEIDWGSY